MKKTIDARDKGKNLSSYQKLKAENKKLLEDICLLVRKSNTIEGLQARTRWEIKLGTEDAIMFGTSAPEEGKIKGITGFIKMMARPYDKAFADLDLMMSVKKYAVFSNGLMVGVISDGDYVSASQYMVINAYAGGVELLALRAETRPNKIILIPGMIGFEETGKEDEHE